MATKFCSIVNIMSTPPKDTKTPLNDDAMDIDPKNPILASALVTQSPDTSTEPDAPLALDTSTATGPTSPASNMSISPASSGTNSPKTAISPQSPIQPFLEGPKNVLKNVQNINSKLQKTKDKLSKLYTNYQKTMKIYGDGYELSIEMATQLAKELAVLKIQANKAETRVVEMAKELEKLDTFKQQLDKQKKDFDDEKAKLMGEVVQARNKLNELNRDNNNKKAEIERLLQKVEETQKNSNVDSSKAATLKNTNNDLVAKLAQCDKERNDLNELLRQTHDYIFELNDTYDRATKEYMDSVQGNKRKRVNLMDSYKAEIDNLTKLNARSDELKQIYESLVRSGVPISMSSPSQ